jgi:hypothetical protein
MHTVLLLLLLLPRPTYGRWPRLRWPPSPPTLLRPHGSVVRVLVLVLPGLLQVALTVRTLLPVPVLVLVGVKWLSRQGSAAGRFGMWP